MAARPAAGAVARAVVLALVVRVVHAVVVLHHLRVVVEPSSPLPPVLNVLRSAVEVLAVWISPAQQRGLPTLKVKLLLPRLSIVQLILSSLRYRGPWRNHHHEESIAFLTPTFFEVFAIRRGQPGGEPGARNHGLAMMMMLNFHGYD